MFNRSKYGKLLKVVLIILAIAVIGLIAVGAYRMYNSYYIVAGATEAVSKFEEAIQTGGNITTKYKEFTVIGTIQIPDIDLKYPILQENSTEALETSVVLMYTAQGLNNVGNSVITGHNYRNGTMFSKLNKLTNGDYIYITDNTGRNIRYKIYNIYEDNTNANTYITRNTDGKKEITLSTYNDENKAKIIIFARAEQ